MLTRAGRLLLLLPVIGVQGKLVVRHLREPTQAPPAGSSAEEFAAARGPPPRRVHVVSGSTHLRPWTENVTRNHRLFAALHNGFDYTFVDPLAARGLLSDDYSPQWLKIRVLQDALRTRGASGHDYVLWVDDDIVFTSPRNIVEGMIARLGEGQEMLLAADAGDPKGGVNSGMMLFRSGKRSMELLNAIWSMSRQAAPGGTLGTCKDQRCLHEQAAIDLLKRMDPTFRSMIRVVKPVEDEFNMNTFYRQSHRDLKRGRKVDYDTDPAKYRWEPHRGLNTCHVTGMEQQLRADLINACLAVAESAFMREAEAAGLARAA